MTSQNRLYRTLLIASFLPVCWLGMMVVHEFGHVLAGWLTGGTVTKVILHPFSISRTDVNPNPSPAVVVWAGPFIGVLLPLLLWGLFAVWKLPGSWLVRFFAGFCLIANGAYIGIGSFQGIGDAGIMLKTGSPVWSLWLFGLVCLPAGFFLWNGLGPKFGFGESKGKVNPKAAIVSFGILVLLLVLMSLLSDVK